MGTCRNLVLLLFKLKNDEFYGWWIWVFWRRRIWFLKIEERWTDWKIEFYQSASLQVVPRQTGEVWFLDVDWRKMYWWKKKRLERDILFIFLFLKKNNIDLVYWLFKIIVISKALTLFYLHMPFNYLFNF